MTAWRSTGPIPLAIQGPITRDPGPMILAIGWPHPPGEIAGRWPHGPGDRHAGPPSNATDPMGSRWGPTPFSARAACTPKRAGVRGWCWHLLSAFRLAEETVHATGLRDSRV